MVPLLDEVDPILRTTWQII